MNKIFAALNVVLGLVASGAGLPSPIWAEERPRSVDIVSKTYTIDRKYKSMTGPQSTQKIKLLDSDSAPPELLWVVGYHAIVIDSAAVKPMAQDFMCHSNLDFSDAIRHNSVFGRNVSPRLFTLSQGEVSINLPRGFGVPILSNEALSLTTQVLNHNIENETFYVRYKVTLDFVRARDLKKPLVPLFTRGAYGLVSLRGSCPYFGVNQPDESKHGPGCLPGANASVHTYRDTFLREFSGHWVVKPGREVNRTLVTKIMDLPFNTTLHYIAVHLHPFAESLELRDLTAGKTLFKSRARGYRNRIGLSYVDHYSSHLGIPVFKDHEYEIVSVYNNTTNADQDAMAVMYLYLQDKDFRKPTLASR